MEDGFSVLPEALKSAAADVASRTSTLARDSAAVGGGMTVQTGDPALDAHIVQLAGQVAAALAGAGRALSSDAAGLVRCAARYAQADLTSGPPIAAG
jgi:hypothetical protein